jgi:CBS domain-containing protein
MKLGEIARVARGVVTGNRALFVMSRDAAKERNLEQFARPMLGSVRELPRSGTPVVHDIPEREVVIIASAHDVETNASLKAYLGDVAPRVATAKGPPIVATYVGIPRFVANPDGLVVTNSFYTVTPRQPMSAKEVASLVERLNAAAIKAAPKGKQYAERHTPRQMETLEI